MTLVDDADDTLARAAAADVHPDAADGTGTHWEAVARRLEATTLELRGLLSVMRATTRMNGFSQGGFCPIYFDDDIYPVALPFADFDNAQMRLAETRQPLDALLLRQLFDFVPHLQGRVMVDIGGFTGQFAAIVARRLRPSHLHVFEPQKVMADALALTLDANGLTDTMTFHRDVVGETGTEMLIGATRPDRLSDTTYLRREGGPLTAVALDDLGLTDVGLIALDFADSKIPALRGMLRTIATSLPVIVTDLSGRDIREIEPFLAQQSYVMQRAGRNAAIFLPG